MKSASQSTRGFHRQQARRKAEGLYSTSSSRGFGRYCRPPSPTGARPQDDVGGEVVVAADERRADAVGVDRDVLRLELADALDVEAAEDDDLHALEAVLVESVAHLADRDAR